MKIKNIPHEEVISLAKQVEIITDQVVRKNLVKNEAVEVTIFALDKDVKISTEGETGDAMVTVLEGSGRFIVDDKEYILNHGQTLVMPANKPHAVESINGLKMLLVLVF